LKYWGGIVREHQASGLSVLAFCDQRKITQTEFYKWRKRLSVTKQIKVDSLVPVTVVDAPTKEALSRIEIRVDRSLSILVQPGFDVATLRDVVGALGHPWSSCGRFEGPYRAFAKPLVARAP